MVIPATRNTIHEQSHKYLSLVDNIVLIGAATIFAQCSFILCGINSMHLPVHTFLSAVYVAANTVLPITLSSACSDVFTTLQCDKLKVSCKEMAAYLFGPISTNLNQSVQQKQERYNMNQLQRMHQCSTLGTLIGICVCAILRVLDHGLQIQRYPMPLIVGAAVGRVFGTLMAVLVTAAS